MLFRKIRGIEFPVVGMGTSRTFDVDDSTPEVFSIRSKIVEECQMNGVTLVDSSPMYGTQKKYWDWQFKKTIPRNFK